MKQSRWIALTAVAIFIIGLAAAQYDAGTTASAPVTWTGALSEWPYLEDYCFSTCDPYWPDETASWTDDADPVVVTKMLSMLNTMNYVELDEFCTGFFNMSDEQVLDALVRDGDSYDDAMSANGAFYLVCDS